MIKLNRINRLTDILHKIESERVEAVKFKNVLKLFIEERVLFANMSARLRLNRFDLAYTN